MPGLRSRSALGGALGVLCFAVGLYGYVVLGWRFDGGGSTLSTALGVAVALVAVALVVLRR